MNSLHFLQVFTSQASVPGPCKLIAALALAICPAAIYAQSAISVEEADISSADLTQNLREVERIVAAVRSWSIIKVIALNAGEAELDNETRQYVKQTKEGLISLQQIVATSSIEASHGTLLDHYYVSQRAAFDGLLTVGAAREQMNRYLLVSLECLSTSGKMCYRVLPEQLERIAEISQYRSRLIDTTRYTASNEVTRSYLRNIFDTLHLDTLLHAELTRRVIDFVRRFP